MNKHLFAGLIIAGTWAVASAACAQSPMSPVRPTSLLAAPQSVKSPDTAAGRAESRAAGETRGEVTANQPPGIMSAAPSHYGSQLPRDRDHMANELNRRELARLSAGGPYRGYRRAYRPFGY